MGESILLCQRLPSHTKRYSTRKAHPAQAQGTQAQAQRAGRDPAFSHLRCTYASWRGTLPCRSMAVRDAPRATRARTMSSWPWHAAHARGVRPLRQAIRYRGDNMTGLSMANAPGMCACAGAMRRLAGKHGRKMQACARPEG